MHFFLTQFILIVFLTVMVDSYYLDSITGSLEPPAISNKIPFPWCKTTLLSRTVATTQNISIICNYTPTVAFLWIASPIATLFLKKKWIYVAKHEVFCKALWSPDHLQGLNICREGTKVVCPEKEKGGLCKSRTLPFRSYNGVSFYTQTAFVDYAVCFHQGFQFSPTFSCLIDW